MARLRLEELLKDEILKTVKMTDVDLDCDQRSSNPPMSVQEVPGENPVTIITMQESG